MLTQASTRHALRLRQVLTVALRCKGTDLSDECQQQQRTAQAAAVKHGVCKLLGNMIVTCS